MADFFLTEGDCLPVMAKLPNASVDAVITDPPYGLSKEPNVAEVMRHWFVGDDYQHRGGGFMGKSWDSFVPGPAYWRQVARVLKPGGHLLAFGGTRTFDLLGIAIRFAGLEYRDTLSFLYGSGFPKSVDISKALDKAAGATREIIGRRTRPDGTERNYEAWDGKEGTAAYGDYGVATSVTGPASELARQWDGWGTALKPAWEPILMFRKPLEGNVAQNVTEHGAGGLNIDATRIGIPADQLDTRIVNARKPSSFDATQHRRAGVTNHNPSGRWPANVLLGCQCDEDAPHDSSCSVALLDAQSGERGKSSGGNSGTRGNRVYGTFGASQPGVDPGYGDTGGASRFFYAAKASKSERNAGLDTPNPHPTVKPIALLRYLTRLITPPEGTILDPFMGSGSTGCAAVLEGFTFWGIDLDPEYVEIARRRIEHWSKQQ